ncbi:MAG: tetratricopeptide repeat protein [Prolixibacteraceae bacterium]
MKRNQFKLTIIFLLLSIIVFGQKDEIYRYQLKREVPLKVGKTFYQSLQNVGTIEDNFPDSLVKNRVEYICKRPGSYELESVEWFKTPLFNLVANRDEADMIIEGTYLIEKNIESEEIELAEDNNGVRAPIVYFELNTTRQASVTVCLTITRNGMTTVYDTLKVEAVSVVKPGKIPATMDELIEKCRNDLSSAVYNYFTWYDVEKYFFNFPSVKVKDKALKEQYKMAKDLFKERKMMELGSLYKRIYQSSPSDEAIQCLGMCYELVGNYPEALKLYKQAPNFHSNTRMKQNTLLLNYLISIGLEPTYIDFE